MQWDASLSQLETGLHDCDFAGSGCPAVAGFDAAGCPLTALVLGSDLEEAVGDLAGWSAASCGIVLVVFYLAVGAAAGDVLPCCCVDTAAVEVLLPDWSEA